MFFHVSQYLPSMSVDSFASDLGLTSGCGNLRRSGCLEINGNISHPCFVSLNILFTLFLRHFKHFHRPKVHSFATRSSSHHVSFLSPTYQRIGHLAVFGLRGNPCRFLFSLRRSRRCARSSSFFELIFMHDFAPFCVPSFVSTVYNSCANLAFCAILILCSQVCGQEPSPFLDHASSAHTRAS